MTQFKKKKKQMLALAVRWSGNGLALLVGSCTHYWRVTLLGKPELVPIIIITLFWSVTATGNIISVIILPVSTKTELT